MGDVGSAVPQELDAVSTLRVFVDEDLLWERERERKERRVVNKDGVKWKTPLCILCSRVLKGWYVFPAVYI